jgi:hypothetical protein
MIGSVPETGAVRGREDMGIVSRLRSYKRCNARRCELIYKKIVHGLSGQENLELEQLRAFCREWVNQRHPQPKWSDIRANEGK